jgi:hypothetical protein
MISMVQKRDSDPLKDPSFSDEGHRALQQSITEDREISQYSTAVVSTSIILQVLTFKRKQVE